MADTSALETIEVVVDRFMFKNKLPKEDWMVYLEHAIDVWRQVNIHHGTVYKQSKLTADSLGRVTMPTDLISLIGVYVPWRGRVWWFTYDHGLVTTVTDGAFDDDYGEGLDVTDEPTSSYGATGGKNYYYMKPDWENRLIYLTNMASTQCTVAYVSSGINASSTTYVESKAQPLIDSYLRWQRAIIDGADLGTQRLRKADYDEAVLMYRRTNLMSAQEWKDQLYKLYTQAPAR